MMAKVPIQTNIEPEDNKALEKKLKDKKISKAEYLRQLVLNDLKLIK